MKNNLLILFAVLGNACVHPEAASALNVAVCMAQAQANGWSHLKSVAKKGIEARTNLGKPRIVPRGRKPEIIVRGTQLFIAGAPVAIGQPFVVWKQVIPGTPRCDGARGNSCNWDELGINVLVENEAVKQFEVFLNLEPWRQWAEKSPDGSPVPPTPDPRPKHPFPGYFEWDGYGIDADTQFWEIRASVDPSRNVRCDYLNQKCGSTTARFSHNAKIYLELFQTTHVSGRLASFAIGRISASAPQLPKP